MAKLLRDYLVFERNVLVLSITAGFLGFSFGLWMPFFPAFVTEELGASPGELGLIISVQTLAYALSVPLGFLADIFGRKRIIVLGTLSYGIALACYSLAPTWKILLAFVTLATICHGIYTGAFGALLLDAVPPEERARAVATQGFLSGLITWSGPIVGAYLYELLGSVRPIFPIVGLIFASVALARAVGLYETLPGGLRSSFSPRDLLRRGTSSFREIARNRSAFSFILSTALLNLAVFGILGGMEGTRAISVLYASKVIGLSSLEIGLWQSASSVIWFLCLLPAGRLADRIGKRRSILLAGLIGVYLSLPIFIAARDLSGVLLSELVGRSCGAIVHAAGLALLADLVPIELRATAMSASSSFTSVISLPGPYVGGLAYERSPQLPFFLAMALAAPALLLVALLVKEPQRGGP